MSQYQDIILPLIRQRFYIVIVIELIARRSLAVGRPREFDIDKAVCIATELFWRKGYEGTSLTDLTNAMGITPPSFYSAFDNKEGLFKKVLIHYQATHFRYSEKALKEPTARAVAERLLYGFADGHTSSVNPAGCLCVNCAMPAVGSSDRVEYNRGWSPPSQRFRIKDGH